MNVPSSSLAIVLLLVGCLAISFGDEFRGNPTTGMSIVLSGVLTAVIVFTALAISGSSIVHRFSRTVLVLFVFWAAFFSSMIWFLISLPNEYFRLPALGIAIASLCAIIIILGASEKILFRCALCGGSLRHVEIKIYTPKYGTLCADCWASKTGRIIESHPPSDNESVSTD